MGLRGSQGKGERHHGAHTESERCRVPPGSLPRGPGSKSSPGFEPKKEPKAASPPATRWDRAPRERAEGERSVQVATSQQTGRTHTHAHTHHRVQQNAV